MRLIVGGGRAAESYESRGSVVVGVRTLSEGGRVGNFSREQVCQFLSCLKGSYILDAWFFFFFGYC